MDMDNKLTEKTNSTEIVKDSPDIEENTNATENMQKVTEKLVPLMNKAEAGIRKGVGSAKDFADKAKDEYIAPAVDKAKASAESGVNVKSLIATLSPKVIAMLIGLLVLLILIFSLIFGGGSNKKIAIKYVESVAENDLKVIKSCLEPEVRNYIDNNGGFIAYQNLYEKEDAMQYVNRVNVSYSAASSRNLDKNELDAINDHFASLLGKDRYGAKKGVEYSVRVKATYSGESYEQYVNVVVVKVKGHWYVAKSDGYYVENDFF